MSRMSFSPVDEGFLGVNASSVSTILDWGVVENEFPSSTEFGQYRTECCDSCRNTSLPYFSLKMLFWMKPNPRRTPTAQQFLSWKKKTERVRKELGES